MMKPSNQPRQCAVQSDLVKRLIKKKPEFSPADVQEITKKILEHMTTSLAQGERIEIRGFGTFCLRQRQSRVARNPRTGEKFQLQNRSVPRFKLGRILHQSLNAHLPESGQ